MNYEINNDTQVIYPINKTSSRIIETEDEYIIEGKPLNIMEHSCEYFGSSYEGRKEGTKKMLGITHKSPIIVEESRKIIFFPTTSPEKNDCVWVNLEKVDKYFENGSKKSTLLFKNGKTLDLNISIGSLTNQVLRATRLKYILDQRITLKEDNIL